jgi:hypothetical protein
VLIYDNEFISSVEFDFDFGSTRMPQRRYILKHDYIQSTDYIFDTGDESRVDHSKVLLVC